MFRKIVLLTITFGLIGCAGSPARISMMSPEDLITVDSYDLCRAYIWHRSKNVEMELIRRKIFSEYEWSLIEQNKIGIGMSELALKLSWGIPRTINTSVGSWGTHKQWVYRRCPSCKAQYVYTENGKITSWQQ